MPTYRHNETDKQIDDKYAQNADSSIPVFTGDNHTRHVSAPQTGAAPRLASTRAGVVKSWDDKPQIINAKAGKRRTQDAN